MPALDLRLIVVTDRSQAAPRAVLDVVRAALAAGAPAIQLRDKEASARELAEAALAMLPHVRAAGARLFLNDRLDVALAVGADGVHLGPDDIPVSAARRVVPDPFLVGFSTDDPHVARTAAAAGASYIGCGAVFGTTTKADIGTERIGTARLDAVARAVDIPVVGIGGIDPSNVADVAATAAAGAAAAGAVMAAHDVAAVVGRLLEPFN